MNLPTTELNDLYHLGTVCLNNCVTDNAIEKLTWIGTSVYPHFMTIVVDTTQKLFLYMKETDGQTPYFVGAGSEFIEKLSRVKDFGIEIQRNHIPRRYHNSTGKNSFCQSTEEAQEYNKLKATIQNFLNNNKIQGQIEEFESLSLKANDLEFKSWINNLFLMSNSLLKKIETPTDQEILKAYQIRRMAYNTENGAKMKKEIKSLFRRSDYCLRRKLNEDLKEIFSNQDPFWQLILKQAYDPDKRIFYETDIASILFEHRQELLTNDTYDHTAYKLLYICENIFVKQKELENPRTELCFQMESIQPADLSKFPNLNLYLSEWVKNNQDYVNLLIEGIVKSFKVIKPDRKYHCSWAHLFCLMIDMKVFISYVNVKNNLKFAEIIYEVLSNFYEDGDLPLSVDTIRRNVGDNQDVLFNQALQKSDKHHKFIQELDSCFDVKIKIRLPK